MSDSAHPTLATFRVVRDQDISGISGTGVVAEGVQFTDGWVVTHWLDQAPMWEPKTDVWHHKGTGPITKIHGHGGATRIVWTADQEAADAELRADIAAAFDVPGWIAGDAAERVSLRRQIRDALQQQFVHQRLPDEDERQGIDELTDIVMPVVDQCLGERDRWRNMAGRAFALAYRWQGAHGSSLFLVRSAGAELLETLNDPETCESENTQDCTLHGWVDSDELLPAAECSAQYHGHQVPRHCIRAGGHHGDHIDERGFRWSDTVAMYPMVNGTVKYGRVPAVNCTNPDHACGMCGNCVNQHPGEGGGCYDQGPPNQGPLTGIEVRDPCPYCESCPLIPRWSMAHHIRENHPEVTLASRENGDGAAEAETEAEPEADRANDLSEIGRLMAEIAQLHEGEDPYTDERLVPTPAQWIWRWNRATPARRLKVAAQVMEAWDRSLACVMEDHHGAIEELRTGSATNGSQACPYCFGAPLFPRGDLPAHVREKHARVLDVLASGANLDEQLAEPETRCRLPHDMEC